MEAPCEESVYFLEKVADCLKDECTKAIQYYGGNHLTCADQIANLKSDFKCDNKIKSQKLVCKMLVF